jgi:hypothetical protein
MHYRTEIVEEQMAFDGLVRLANTVYGKLDREALLERAEFLYKRYLQVTTVEVRKELMIM